MAIFAYRPAAFKAGFVLLFASFVGYVVGYACPYWSSLRYNFIEPTSGFRVEAKHHEGVWQACQDVSSDDYPSLSASMCQVYGFIGVVTWFQAVRYLTLCGGLAAFFGLMYGVVVNCRSAGGQIKRHAETNAIVGGLLAFVGCMVYVAFRNDSLTVGEEEMNVAGATVRFEEMTRDWAFYLCSVSSALMLVAGIVIAATNKYVDVPRQPDNVAMTHVGGGAYAPPGQPNVYVYQPPPNAYQPPPNAYQPPPNAYQPPPVTAEYK